MATEEEFRELVSGDAEQDIVALVDVARHGIPDNVRGIVWKLLLGVSKFDKVEEMKLSKKHMEEYQELLLRPTLVNEQRIRNQIKRHVKNEPRLQKKNMGEMLEHIIHAYVVHESCSEHFPGLIHMGAPFVVCVAEEHEAFFCFLELMHMVEEQFIQGGLRKRVSHLMTLFRAVLPDLYMHFEDEEVGPNDWATGWLRTLLAQELPLNAVLRLWDTYFSCEEGLELHYYVCIAILAECSEELTDLEESELKGFLQHLPLLDMDKIIIKAYNYRGEVHAREII